MKKFLAAAFLFAFYLPLEAQDADAQYSKALMLKNEKKYSEAAEILSKITGHSEQFRIDYQTADCYINMGNADDAIIFAKKSIELKDDFPEAYIVLYNAYNSKKMYLESSDVLFRLCELVPDNPEYLYTLGLVNYSQLNNLFLAKYVFDSFINSSYTSNIPPQFMEKVYIYLSEINADLERYPEAVENIKKACEYNPQNRTRLFRLAGNLANANKIPESIDAYEYFLKDMTEEQKRNPLTYNIYAYLGNIYYTMSDIRAAGYIRKSLANSGDDLKIQRALFNEITGNDEEAYSQLQAIAKDNDRFFPVFIALGKVCERMKKKDEAGAAYLRAGELLAPTNLYAATARINLKAAQMTKSDEALKRASTTFEIMKMPSMAIVTIDAANALKYDIENDLLKAYIASTVKDTDLFSKTIDKVKKKNPAYARTYFIAGLAYLEMNNPEKAKPELLAAVRLEPQAPYYKYHAAGCLDRLGEQKESIKLIEDALKIDADNPSYQNYVGYSYADAGVKIDEAEKYIKTALEKDPNNGAFLDSLGWVYFRQGDYPKALTYLYRSYQNLKAIGAEDPTVFDHMGDAYLKMGKKDKAVEFWKKSIGITPNRKIQTKIEEASK